MKQKIDYHTEAGVGLGMGWKEQETRTEEGTVSFPPWSLLHLDKRHSPILHQGQVQFLSDCPGDSPSTRDIGKMSRKTRPASKEMDKYTQKTQPGVPLRVLWSWIRFQQSLLNGMYSDTTEGRAGVSLAGGDVQGGVNGDNSQWSPEDAGGRLFSHPTPPRLPHLLALGSRLWPPLKTFGP